MERRGYRFVRYADDILILCRSQRSAEHAMSVAMNYLEGELKLTVNRRKTCLTQASKGVTFLGFVIGVRSLRIADKRIAALKTKIKELTRRSGQENLRDVIAKLNPVLRGWTNYFRIANCKTQSRQLQKWIRRRLRARQITLWKDPAFQTDDPRLSEIVNSFRRMKKKAWRLSRTPFANKAISNRYLLLFRLFNMERVQVGYLRKG